jgi:hypothetical protein
MTNPLLEFLGGAGFVPLIPIIMFWAWVPLLAVVLCECDDRALAMVPGDGQTRAGE